MKQLSRLETDLIAEVTPDAILRRVLQWSAINSGTSNLAGLAIMADMIGVALAELPGQLTRHKSEPETAINAQGISFTRERGAHLVLSVRPQAQRRLLLTGHMDTVFGADHPFQSLTWLDDNTLNGPGVADMKGGIAVMLEALRLFEAGPSAAQIGYDVLINSDEETGSITSAPLIAQLAQGKHAALTYEPSALPDGTLAGERAGSGNYSLVVKGRAAHAGRNPQDGRNAIVAAAALVLGLKRLETPGLAINPAAIDGGSALNVVPDMAVLRFNIRPRSAEDDAIFLCDLYPLIDEIAAAHDVTIHLHGGTTRPPKPLDAKAERLFALVRDCGAALGQPIRWQSSGGVCDGNNIAACGVPVVDTLGVRGGAIHSADEYLIVPSLAERAALSALVLLRIADGELA